MSKTFRKNTIFLYIFEVVLILKVDKVFQFALLRYSHPFEEKPLCSTFPHSYATPKWRDFSSLPYSDVYSLHLKQNIDLLFSLIT